MIQINSYLHRVVLDDIIRRWMYGDARPDDEESIVRLVQFNNLFLCRCLGTLAENVFGGSREEGTIFHRISRKGGLKDVLIENPPYRNDRIDFLIREYLRRPGHYYRETPFHGVLVSRKNGEGSHYAGSYRIKRARRIAEKSARRIADRVFAAIRKGADSLAEGRARRIGVPRHELITSPEEMNEEFLRAEEAFLDDLRNHRPLEETENLAINDVGGLKIVWENPSLAPLCETLSRAGCTIVEQEEHRGQYNAVNLTVRYRPLRELILSPPVRGHTLSYFQEKGWDDASVNHAFAEFVESGEESVILEIIVSTFQEMLESEIGRCMHEDRIMEQRAAQPYRGHLARNIGYLLEYLFTIPEAPPGAAVDLPIRIWDRYLPDTFFELMKGLFRIPSANPLE
ncbi:MAG TPA: hypothetical protein PLO63_07850 [Syntrophales bacterium]|jgi:hypothetical protein|nr:hypothetical protein [Syntrophales bacterium]